MGLLDKSLKARKRFSGTNIQMLNALKKMITDSQLEIDDDVVISMPPETYEKLKTLGYYVERPRTSDRRHGGRRKGDRRAVR